jgi:hypothetical protein
MGQSFGYAGSAFTVSSAPSFLVAAHAAPGGDNQGFRRYHCPIQHPIRPMGEKT